ncbi:TenA family protein [Nesterenkonia populi]|uniref:TenA family protein n=1 Tax=Nesterenkonia populi TaxID=1591087 RepID=UPI0011BF38E6|nr:TenA family protein [Nesterenkonia populi]
MAQRFSTQLREQTQPAWDQAVGHRFVDELISGTVKDAHMAAYLIQDHRFLDAFLTLLGGAMTAADTMEARLRFSQFAGMISSEENTYFLRSFEALGVTEQQRRETPETVPCAEFQSIMREAARTQDYAAILAVLTVAEWLYGDWAGRAGDDRPESFVHAEWIDLHHSPEFDAWVEFLRCELDRVGPDAEATARDFFSRSVDLELEFFNAVYENGENL